MTSEMWAAVVGLFMPYIIEFVKAVLDSKQRWLGFVTAYVVSVLVAAGTAAITGEFDFQNVAGSVGALLLTSQTVYNLYFQPQKIDEKVARLIR